MTSTSPIASVRSTPTNSACFRDTRSREVVGAAIGRRGRDRRCGAKTRCARLETERTDLARAVEDPGKPLEERLRTGLALALIGDPRIADEPLVITLPPGPATIGTPVENVDDLVRRYPGTERSWFVKETPQYRAHVQVFALAKYPVTNQEYARFAADAGHAAPSWWQGAEPPARYRNH